MALTFTKWGQALGSRQKSWRSLKVLQRDERRALTGAGAVERLRADAMRCIPETNVGRLNAKSQWLRLPFYALEKSYHALHLPGGGESSRALSLSLLLLGVFLMVGSSPGRMIA